jgi:signal transduction histidine kinase
MAQQNNISGTEAGKHDPSSNQSHPDLRTLGAIYTHVQKNLPMDMFFICIFEPDSRTVSYPLVYDNGKPYQEPVTPLAVHTNTRRAIESARPFMINREERVYSQASFNPYAVGDKTKRSASLLFAPVIANGQVTGAISAQTYHPHSYTEQHLNFLSSVAECASIVLENRESSLVAELKRKNKELERFSYIVSHDLKSPLFTLRSYLKYAEIDLNSGHREQLKRDLFEIDASAQKMEQLIDELLELSRAGRLINKFEEIPFETVVREALTRLSGQIRERRIRMDVADNLPIVSCDRIRLVQVMQNLLENAIKFMGDQPNPRIEIGVKPGAVVGQAAVFVRDNGIGIAHENQEKVFDLFNKLDHQTAGSGVGLALVKRILEAHNGNVWVASDGVGKGTTIYFSLPMIRKE